MSSSISGAVAGDWFKSLFLVMTLRNANTHYLLAIKGAPKGCSVLNSLLWPLLFLFASPSSLAVMVVVMKCDASLWLSLVVAIRHLCLRGWKNSSKAAAKVTPSRGEGSCWGTLPLPHEHPSLALPSPDVLPWIFPITPFWRIGEP